MMLRGIGDPSNGNGGYSFLKLPLKVSSNDANRKTVHSELDLNKYRYLQNVKSVTGTDADLRKLNKDQLKRRLMDFGLKSAKISKLARWECVDLLRYKSSEAASLGFEGAFLKFARGVRVTTKTQKELYQKQVNQLFQKQVMKTIFIC